MFLQVISMISKHIKKFSHQKVVKFIRKRKLVQKKTRSKGFNSSSLLETFKCKIRKRSLLLWNFYGFWNDKNPDFQTQFVNLTICKLFLKIYVFRALIQPKFFYWDSNLISCSKIPYLKIFLDLKSRHPTFKVVKHVVLDQVSSNTWGL